MFGLCVPFGHSIDGQDAWHIKATEKAVKTEKRPCTHLSRMFCLLMASLVPFLAEAEVVTRSATIIKANHYGLSNALYADGCPMSYDPALVETLGAAFSCDYTDPNPGTGGMDAYVSGSIGGFKSGGVWYPADPSLCGMPVQLPDLGNDLRIQWKVSQENAWDAGDKWWATINVIFDDGPELAEPVSTNRLFDIVIEFDRYEQDALDDNPNGNTSYWWFARNPDGSIKPFTLHIDGVEYAWAVRYKFFRNSGWKDEKVHIKFIPVDNSNVAPYLDHPLETFCEAGIEYLDYTDLPAAERALADLRVCNPSLWVKRISAGYEVYTGAMTIRNDHFLTVMDTTPPDMPTGLSAVTNTQGEAVLDWDDHAENDFEAYAIWRADNGGSFSLVADDVRESSYTDQTVLSGNSYEYYITTLDRSFNASLPSSTAVLQPEHIESAPVFSVDPIDGGMVMAGNSYSGTLAGSATDANGDPLSYTLLAGPAWLEMTPNGALFGNPGAQDQGLNSWQVQVSDGNGGADTAMLEIHVFMGSVSLVSAPLTVTDDANGLMTFSNVTVKEGDVVAISSALNKSSTDNPLSLQWSGVEGLDGTSTTVHPGNATGWTCYLFYVQITNAGTYDFIVTADNTGLTGQSSLHVLRSDSGRVGVADTQAAVQTTASPGFSYAFPASVSNAVAIEVFANNQKPIFTPDTDYQFGFDYSGRYSLFSSHVSGTAWNRLHASDSSQSFACAGAVFQSIPTNGVPIFTADPLSGDEAEENRVYGGTLSGSATDPDSDALTYSKASGPAWLDIASDGTLSGTPRPEDRGPNHFLITVSDGAATDLATLEITVLSTYEAWAKNHSLNPNDTDKNSDPDGDGLNNLIEYALGGDPSSPSDAASIAPVVFMVHGGGTNWMEYCYRRRTDAAARGLSYSLELTDDLTGSWNTNGYSETGTAPIDAAFEMVSNRVGVVESCGFIRLRIEEQN
jgi:hypothetical protein